MRAWSTTTLVAASDAEAFAAASAIAFAAAASAAALAATAAAAAAVLVVGTTGATTTVGVSLGPPPPPPPPAVFVTVTVTPPIGGIAGPSCTTPWYVNTAVLLGVVPLSVIELTTNPGSPASSWELGILKRAPPVPDTAPFKDTKRMGANTGVLSVSAKAFQERGPAKKMFAPVNVSGADAVRVAPVPAGSPDGPIVKSPVVEKLPIPPKLIVGASKLVRKFVDTALVKLIKGALKLIAPPADKFAPKLIEVLAITSI